MAAIFVGPPLRWLHVCWRVLALGPCKAVITTNWKNVHLFPVIYTQTSADRKLKCKHDTRPWRPTKLNNSRMTSTDSDGIYVDSIPKHDETSTATVGEGARELSQTDHLNKQLLDSFLQRLNESQPDASVSSANNTDFDDDKPQTD